MISMSYRRTTSSRIRCWQRCVAGAAALVVALLITTLLDTSGVKAQAEPAPLGTFIDILTPSSATVGERITISVQLYTALDPQPGALGNEAIELFIDGTFERRVRGDEQGLATFVLSPDRPAGLYQLTAQYGGTSDLAASTNSAFLTIEPASIKIQTIPPEAGLRFSLDDNVAESNSDGLVEFHVSNTGTFHLDFIGSADPEARVYLDRWGDEVFTHDRTVEVKGDISLEAGFEIHYPVSISFVDLQGNPVPADQITAVSMTSNHGQRVTLTNDELDVWLQASRVTRRRDGLELVPALWSIESVEINGTSVVNRNQQRFDLISADSWKIELLLFSAHVTARDSFFRFPIGTGIELHYPDGTTKFFPFDSNDEVKLYSMPRGDYFIRVVGVSGMAPLSPVALTRNQEVDLLVLSYLDIGAAGAVAFAIVLGLLLAGRPGIPRYIWRIVTRAPHHRVPGPVGAIPTTARPRAATVNGYQGYRPPKLRKLGDLSVASKGAPPPGPILTNAHSQANPVAFETGENRAQNSRPPRFRKLRDLSAVNQAAVPLGSNTTTAHESNESGYPDDESPKFRKLRDLSAGMGAGDE